MTRYPKPAKIYGYRYKTGTCVFGADRTSFRPLTYFEAQDAVDELSKGYVREIVELKVVREFRRGKKS